MAVANTALKLGCITNFDILFLVVGFISLVDEIRFMLISSRHICIKSMEPPDMPTRTRLKSRRDVEIISKVYLYSPTIRTFCHETFCQRSPLSTEPDVRGIISEINVEFMPGKFMIIVPGIQ